MGIVLQAIKPRAGSRQFAAVVQAVKDTQQQAVKELLQDYEKTTATWDNQPRWRIRIGKDRVEVYTASEIWTFVDQGTRPHEIRARRAKVLAFAGGYSAKTRPGSIIAGSGGPSGDTRFAQAVQHPGTKARGFSRRLRAKWKDKWPKMLRAAVAKAGGTL